MKRLEEGRAVARIRKRLDALPYLPNRELLALSSAAKTLIDGLKEGERRKNELRFQLGAVLLEGQEAAKSDGHYLAWCSSLGLQARTAQNYVRMARAFGECTGPFCSLKTTTVYRLAAANEDIQSKAMAAAREGLLTPASASALLKTEPQPRATPSEGLTRVAAIFKSLKPRAREELLELLPAINLKELLAVMSDAKPSRRAASKRVPAARVDGDAGGRESAPDRAAERPPMDTLFLVLDEKTSLSA